MRITFRLIISLTLAVTAIVSFYTYSQVRDERRRQYQALRQQLEPVSERAAAALETAIHRNSNQDLTPYLNRLNRDEKILGSAVYSADNKTLFSSYSLRINPRHLPAALKKSASSGVTAARFEKINERPMYVYSFPLNAAPGASTSAALFVDAGDMQEKMWVIGRSNFLRLLIQMILIALITLLFVRWSVAGPIAQMADWMKKLRAGEYVGAVPPPKSGIFAPIAKEVSTFALHLVAAKTAAEKEASLRRTAESIWTPERLKEHVKVKLKGRPLFVVSNREPYQHMRRGRRMEYVIPAGGLVTALDPVLRSCGGTWIAHGNGDADFEMVDDRNRLRVPPDDPHYTLKRVALSKEEENGYYYGFANEGIWPLCHIAYTRPVFRPEDWAQYQAVNQKFADATLEELEDIDDPCILIQDYHFALLPRLIKDKKPNARIALFWHIPWPNPEAFGICPWQRELIDGMLGADLIGFHTQFHCNNFLNTVDRAMESRLDWERFSISKDGHTTLVKPFPISVSFPEPAAPLPANDKGPQDKADLFKELGVKGTYLGIGVERMDYTKGVLERLRSIERFLEKYPAYQGKFVFAQFAAPSRTHIKRYHDFLGEVEAEVERINWKFNTRDYKPIVYLKKQHSHAEINPFYKHADLCMVTSLHDGMNLVAKEFVAARTDNRGMLILSQFTGASRELRDALIINPYDTDQMAEAIRYALEMDPEEASRRMAGMRDVLREHNIYKWAGDLINELTKIRVDDPLTPVGAP